MKYYRSTITGNLFNETDLMVVDDIYGANAVEKVISDGTLEEIEPPSVVDFLKEGYKARATRRYREIHGCSLKEAVDAVRKIEKEMEKLKNE